tara:strand:+ start:59 stop:334 length:276 start_codon:yes stop_codon:yes gene_type:complete
MPATKGVVKQKRAKKDPNAPKRPMSSYMIWMNASRGRIKEENPTAEIKDIARLAGAEWAKMGPPDKAEWEDKAKADKARYEKEMAKYRGTA